MSVSYSRAVRSAIRMVSTRLVGSRTTAWPRAGAARMTMSALMTPMRFMMVLRLSAARQQRTAPGRRAVGRQFQVVRQVDLDAVPFADRDRRQAIQEAVHRLGGCLRGGFGGAAGDDDRAGAPTEGRRSHELRESGNQANRG